MVERLLDLALALALPVLAVTSLATRDLLRAVVLFVAFGLVLALAWVRLHAPDVALAEVALGAGLTGALLIDACGRLAPSGPPARTRPVSDWVALLLAGGVAAALASAVLTAPAAPTSLALEVSRRAPESGVENKVTAVLLNFRAYDTLLEVGVLWLAWIAVRAAGARSDSTTPPPSPVLVTLVRVLAPLLLMLAAAVLWAGAAAPGGAFQAGAVLAGAGIFLHLAQAPVQLPTSSRSAVAVGLLAFLLAAAWPLAHGRQLLELQPRTAGVTILLLEVAAALSIGVTLTAMYRGFEGDEAAT